MEFNYHPETDSFSVSFPARLYSLSYQVTRAGAAGGAETPLETAMRKSRSLYEARGVAAMGREVAHDMWQRRYMTMRNLQCTS